jgi:four helix bundle protein
MAIQRHNFRKLDIWKDSISLATDVIKATRTLPDVDKFGLVSQMNRSAVSIPSNIAEGTARKSNKSFVNFLEISLGSGFELESQLIISNNVNYIKQSEFEDLIRKTQSLQNRIFTFIEKLENEK